MSVLLLLLVYLANHSTAAVAISSIVFAQAGNTLPDLGTPEFFKVWAHELFRALSASTKKKP
jgi:hypothetical protein